jgi:FAD/FMN-containing dehydrogenase
VITPDDSGYDQTRVVVAGDVDRRPAVIVRPAGAADVACTVRLAAETGADLAVRSGGHSASGHGVCDDGIVLDLRDLRSLDIDIDGRTAWAQTGLTAGDYTAAVGAHGLATGFGDTGTESIDRDAAETILDHLRASDAVMRVAQLRVLGGAIARVPADATAFAHRDRRIMVNVAAFFNGDDRAQKLAWVTELAAAVQGEPGAYVNFLGDDGPQRIREAYPAATWDRLAAVKRRYDPTNLFRLNQNILPAQLAGG